jgi:glycosyltransferase involved in cell wall biosynthesis
MIYQLLDSRSAGGIETHVLNLSRWLIRKGFKCQVLLLKDYGPHPLKAQLDEASVPWKALDSIYELHHLINKKPCLLATHGYKAGIIGRAVAKFNNLAVVSTYHSGDRGNGKLRCYSTLDELSARLANSVISVSAEIAARLPVNSAQVPNFVDLPPFKLNKGKQIAFVGRVSSEKGPDVFAQITQAYSDSAPIAVYGEGPMLDSLRKAYPSINWYGRVDMEKHWHKIGLLCITSHCEGLPLVTLEAMARGIPVISYALGDIPKVIEHKRNGWLIEPENTAQFSTAVEHWLNLNTVAKQGLSQNAYLRIESKFSSDIVVPKILPSYCRALAYQ